MAVIGIICLLTAKLEHVIMIIRQLEWLLGVREMRGKHDGSYRCHQDRHHLGQHHRPGQEGGRSGGSEVEEVDAKLSNLNTTLVSTGCAGHLAGSPPRARQPCRMQREIPPHRPGASIGSLAATLLMLNQNKCTSVAYSA